MTPEPSVPADVRSGVASALDLGGGSEPFGVVEGLGGGCIHPAARIRAPSGEDFFLKWSTERGSRGFAVEAEGLRALARTGGPRVPEVFGFEDGDATSRGWLLLEFIVQGPSDARTGVLLGEALARMHKTRSDATPGWDRDGFIGPLPQRNRWESHDWPRFWVEARLVPQWERAHARMDHDTARAWDRLLARMEEGLDGWESDGLALLHGDLWSGNALTDHEGAPVLIDPAVYRGHREVDLAMMELFGGFGRRTFERYGELAPLAPGFRERRCDLYQLYPLLVHVNLFGGSYVPAVRDRIHRQLDRMG